MKKSSGNKIAYDQANDVAQVTTNSLDHAALTSLSLVRPLYLLPADPLADEVLIPGFQASDRVSCMVGFFSSAVLSEIAPGLASYIESSSNSFRLIISPFLRPEDLGAIKAGMLSSEAIACELLEELTITKDKLEQHTLHCLSYLLRTGRIEIKIALMKDALFHPKVWIFEQEKNAMSVHGSSNLTRAGIRKNFEQVSVSRSWEDSNQSYTNNKLLEQFERLWLDKEQDCVVITIPHALRDQIIKTYPDNNAPTSKDFRDLYDRAQKRVGEANFAYEFQTPIPPQFYIPESLQYKDGPFRHQGKAVAEWNDSGFKGVLEMATGSGKTITSMIGAHCLYENQKPLLVVIAAPYVPLIEQWCDEVKEFGKKPINLRTVGGKSKRSNELQKLKRRLRSNLSDIEIVVVSHDTLCSSEFLAAVESFDCKRLLIADEVHNLGRPSFTNNPPEFFEYRLGLSATPIRQYDLEGTVALFGFFGPVVFSFTLEEAIGRCLVEYDYYVHPVYLTQTEMGDWFDLTGKIKRNAWRSDGSKPDEYLVKLLRDRRALLETASGKVSRLRELINDEDTSNLRHTLVYTSDKGPDQLNSVNRLLRDKNILFHQLTADETANGYQTKRIIKSFQDGDIQVLTAKRVLDEGVNIPQICRAYVLASTTVERQWVQRRGRLLRTCSAIGKTHSVIHDLLALPPGMDEGLDSDARTLVRSELRRAQEFARLARNAGRPDGPLTIINQMVDAAYL